MEKEEQKEEQKSILENLDKNNYIFCNKSYSTLKYYSGFYEAKKGNWKIARKIANNLFNPTEFEPLLNQIKDIKLQEPLLIIPVIKKNNNINKIPIAYGEKLKDHLFKEGIPARNIKNIYQISSDSDLKRHSLSGVDRLLIKPKFEGTIQKGANYLIVDDIITQGRTLNELKNYIENNGGKVVGMSALAHSKIQKEHTVQLKGDQNLLNSIEKKFNTNELNKLLKEYNITGDYKKLINGELRCIANFGGIKTLEDKLKTIKNKITVLNKDDIKEEFNNVSIDQETTNIKEEIKVTEYQNNKDKRIYIYEINELVYGTSQKIETLKELDVSICYIYENIKDANLHFKQNGYNKIEKPLKIESLDKFLKPSINQNELEKTLELFCINPKIKNQKVDTINSISYSKGKNTIIINIIETEDYNKHTIKISSENYKIENIIQLKQLDEVTKTITNNGYKKNPELLDCLFTVNNNIKWNVKDEDYIDKKNIQQEKKYELEEVEGGCKITKYLDLEKNVIIPSEINGIKVVEIGEEAFCNNELQSIVIPDSVKKIEENAFASNKLANLEIPDSVEMIGEGAFSNNKLKNVKLPKLINEAKNIFDKEVKIENEKNKNKILER